MKLIILIKVNKLKHKETKESSEDVLETNKSQKIEQKEQKASSNETSNKELNSYTKDKTIKLKIIKT